jgi:hypothetical protein
MGAKSRKSSISILYIMYGTCRMYKSMSALHWLCWGVIWICGYILFIGLDSEPTHNLIGHFIYKDT